MGREHSAANLSLHDDEHISLCETLDRVLNKGVVVSGELVISVADIDLIYLGLNLMLSSVETARQARATGAAAKNGPLFVSPSETIQESRRNIHSYPGRSKVKIH